VAEQRLPIVSGDDGSWGEILNQFIETEHYNTGADNAANGGHKTVTIRAGTTGAGTAPLKFASGSLMSSPEAGAVEFLTDKLYFTQTTGATRKTLAIYDDSSGAAGDLYYRDSSGNFVRLGIGSPGNVLAVNGSNLPAWTAGGGGSGISRSVNSISTATTAGDTIGTDYVYLVSGTTTLTLPTAVGNTNRYTVTNTGAATVTVATTSSQTINGSLTVTLPISNMALEFISDNANWTIQ
jgi:hypothetical protein